MNYRRGFQRIYAVLTVAWAATVMLLLPADRVNFGRQQNTAAHEAPVVESVTWTGERTQEIDFRIRGRNFQPGCLVLIAQYTQAGGWKYRASLQPHETTAHELIVRYAGLPANEDMAVVENPDERMSRAVPFLIAAEQPKWESFYEHITLAVPVDSRIERFLCLLGLLMLPPAFGYAVLFYFAPWIFRGFKATEQPPQGQHVRPT
jgi:hypothetical protein